MVWFRQRLKPGNAMAVFSHTRRLDEAVQSWSGVMEAPSAEARLERDGIAVFTNPFVERFLARSHFVMPGIWFLPLLAYGIWITWRDPQASGALALLCLLLGCLGFSLLEYLMHRFIFHMPIGETFASKKRVFLVHGYHHEFVNDRWRLVAPPVMSWPIAMVVGAGCYFFVGTTYAWAVFCGFVVGYLAYDWIHYYTHHGRPTTRVGKFLRRYHLEHHYKDSTTHFGISHPLWDVVFGTYAPREALVAAMTAESSQA